MGGAGQGQPGTGKIEAGCQRAERGGGARALAGVVGVVHNVT